MLIHYIIVRRDLPLGILAAMITHAAGESAALWRDTYGGDFKGCTAVVLESKSESGLHSDLLYLHEHDIEHVAVHESQGTYAGQLMAIGVIPAEREQIAEKFGEFQCLKALDNAAQSA